ncbi:MAG: hypothetical protein HYU37_09760 [Acidobacteria bacterium]|nr:hypothetical protein [Acidobacteriota bacterium]
MRDITKSMLSYSWAMSMFGIQQATNLFRRGQRTDNRAAEAFEDVTGTVVEQFDETFKSAFRAGDNLQRGMVDLMFGWMGMLNTRQWARSAERMAAAARARVGRDGAYCQGDDRGWSDGSMPPGSSFGRPPAGSSAADADPGPDPDAGHGGSPSARGYRPMSGD